MKYFIITYGCQMNKSDSERIAAVLENAGYKKTNKINKADLIIIVMCSVRQPAVDRVHFLARKIKMLKNRPLTNSCELVNDKPISILTGCVLQKDKKKMSEFFDYIIDTKNIQKLPQIIQKKPARKMDGRPFYGQGNYLDITPKYSSKTAAFVPIMTGCNNFCSYCVVPYTRGREISRPAKKIIKEVKNLIKKGYEEIWLLGQNVNNYSNILQNIGIVNFPKLLKVVNDIPGNFKLNFLTSHPKDFSDELIETMKNCKKLSKRLNLPIQSGDDKILKKMNRPYTVAQYKNLVEKIRREIPDISLSTDVIVGFPGETKKQFENTVKTFKQIGFDMAFINKYSPRPGTAAAKLKDDVSWEEKKKREKILIDLINKRK